MNTYKTPKPDRYSTVSLIGATVFSAFLFLAIPMTQLIHFSGDVAAPKTEPIKETPPPPPPPPPPEVITPPSKQAPDTQMLAFVQAAGKRSSSQQGAKMAIEPLAIPSSVPNPNATVAVDYTVSFGVNAEDLGSLSIFEIAQVDEIPVPINRISPNIPYALRNREGSVEVIFVVDEDGNVIDPEIKTSSDSRFNDSVLTAIKRWRFKPGKRGGETVKVRMLQPFKITVQ